MKDVKNTNYDKVKVEIVKLNGMRVGNVKVIAVVIGELGSIPQKFQDYVKQQKIPRKTESCKNYSYWAHHTSY